MSKISINLKELKSMGACRPGLVQFESTISPIGRLFGFTRVTLKDAFYDRRFSELNTRWFVCKYVTIMAEHDAYHLYEQFKAILSTDSEHIHRSRFHTQARTIIGRKEANYSPRIIGLCGSIIKAKLLDLVGLWIDSRNQYLHDKNTFTPERRAFYESINEMMFNFEVSKDTIKNLKNIYRR